MDGFNHVASVSRVGKCLRYRSFEFSDTTGVNKARLDVVSPAVR